jgi:hypothetical protein
MTLPVNVGLRSKPRKMGDAVLGSWTRTAAVAAVILIAFVVVAVLALTGRMGDLRYANIPLVRPYPPAGYYQNPFNQGDHGDLVNSSDASRVKADLLSDGAIQLDALARSDASQLPTSASGGFLINLQRLVASNSAKGLVEQEKDQLNSVLVGRLRDPNDPSATWCVQESGTGTSKLVDKASGKVLSQQAFRFQSKFWLVRSGGRYLIVDAQINSQPTGSG